MRKISELIVKRLYWKEKETASLYCTHIIAKYASGRTVGKSFYTENDIPYTIKDYMNIDNLKGYEEYELPGSPFRIKAAVYREGA